MEFSPEQAVAAAEAAGIDLKKELFTAGALAAGMTAELEHGAGSPDTDITNNDPILTAKLAVDEVIDLYYHGGSYDSFHGFCREGDGRNAVFLYFDRTLRSDVMPDREGHLCIGNGLLTDFETATYQVDRQVDAVYYLVGDYLELPGLAQAEFEQAVADAVLLWER